MAVLLAQETFGADLAGHVENGLGDGGIVEMRAVDDVRQHRRLNAMEAADMGLFDRAMAARDRFR